MAALPTTGTHRILVPFIWRDRQSLTLFRFQPDAVLIEAQAAIVDFLSTIDDVMLGNSGWGAFLRVYPSGSTVSHDVSITPNSGGGGGGDSAAYADALTWEVLGRSGDGRRASWYFRGLGIDLTPNQRAQGAVDAAAQVVIDAVEFLTTAGLCTISTQTPVLKGYVNEVYNDYLTRISRRG